MTHQYFEKNETSPHRPAPVPFVFAYFDIPKVTSPRLPPGVEPDPGAEGRKEPYPAGADAPGGGGAQPLGRPGTRGHPR